MVGFWLKVKVKFMDDEIKSYKNLNIWQQGIVKAIASPAPSLNTLIASIYSKLKRLIKLLPAIPDNP